MSRIGKKIIQIPEGITVNIVDGLVTVKGKTGELRQVIHPLVKVEQKDNEIVLGVVDEEDKKQKALWGTTRQLISNMIEGLSKGFQKSLEVNGVGYRIALQGQSLILNVGYSHPIDFKLPAGITATVEKNVITLSGADKHLIGETAAGLRKIRKPEPYKGKGIKYTDETIRRKAGKQVKGGS